MSRNTGRLIEINKGRFEEVQTLPYPVFLGEIKMSEKRFQWYSLPEEVREKLMSISAGFYNLKDTGMWILAPAGYEPETIVVLRTYSCLSYDVFIPTIINMMRDGVLTAIFPIGMKVVDIVFYQFDMNNSFFRNAYRRAGLEINIEVLSRI